MLSYLQCPISSFVTTNLETSIWSTFNASYTVLKLTRVSFLRFGVTVSLLTLNPLSTADWLWHSVSKSLNTHQRPSKFFLFWRCVYRKVSTLCVQFWNSSSLSFFATSRKLLYWSNRSSAAVKIFSLCLKNFPCVTAKFPVFSLSGKSKSQIPCFPCFPCAVATLSNFTLTVFGTFGSSEVATLTFRWNSLYFPCVYTFSCIFKCKN